MQEGVGNQGNLSQRTEFTPFRMSESTKKNAVIAAKVVTVALVVAGLAAASIATFGAAIPAGTAAFAAIGTEGALGSFVGAGALWGTGTGLAMSTVTAGYLAKDYNVFEYTGNDLP